MAACSLVASGATAATTSACHFFTPLTCRAMQKASLIQQAEAETGGKAPSLARQKFLTASLSCPLLARSRFPSRLPLPSRRARVRRCRVGPRFASPPRARSSDHGSPYGVRRQIQPAPPHRFRALPRPLPPHHYSSTTPSSSCVPELRRSQGNPPQTP
jgi:hypothetical protein